MKFRKGDKITPMKYHSGFSDAMVLGCFERDGRQYYKLKILRGTATIPVSAEISYTLVKE